MVQAQNSDSESPLKKQNPTPGTDFRLKLLCTICYAPCTLYILQYVDSESILLPQLFSAFCVLSVITCHSFFVLSCLIQRLHCPLSKEYLVCNLPCAIEFNIHILGDFATIHTRFLPCLVSTHLKKHIQRIRTADFLMVFYTQVLSCLVSTHLKTDSTQLTRGCRVYTADGLSRLLSVLVWILPFNKRRLAKPLGMNNRSKKCKFVLTC